MSPLAAAAAIGGGGAGVLPVDPRPNDINNRNNTTTTNNNNDNNNTPSPRGEVFSPGLRPMNLWKKAQSEAKVYHGASTRYAQVGLHPLMTNNHIQHRVSNTYYGSMIAPAPWQIRIWDKKPDKLWDYKYTIPSSRTKRLGVERFTSSGRTAKELAELARQLFINDQLSAQPLPRAHRITPLPSVSGIGKSTSPPPLPDPSTSATTAIQINLQPMVQHSSERETKQVVGDSSSSSSSSSSLLPPALPPSPSSSSSSSSDAADNKSNKRHKNKNNKVDASRGAEIPTVGGVGLLSQRLSQRLSVVDSVETKKQMLASVGAAGWRNRSFRMNTNLVRALTSACNTWEWSNEGDGGDAAMVAFKKLAIRVKEVAESAHPLSDIGLIPPSVGMVIWRHLGGIIFKECQPDRDVCIVVLALMPYNTKSKCIVAMSKGPPPKKAKTGIAKEDPGTKPPESQKTGYKPSRIYSALKRGGDFGFPAIVAELDGNRPASRQSSEGTRRRAASLGGDDVYSEDHGGDRRVRRRVPRGQLEAVVKSGEGSALDLFELAGDADSGGGGGGVKQQVQARREGDAAQERKVYTPAGGGKSLTNGNNNNNSNNNSTTNTNTNTSSSARQSKGKSRPVSARARKAIAAAAAAAPSSAGNSNLDTAAAGGGGGGDGALQQLGDGGDDNSDNGRIDQNFRMQHSSSSRRPLSGKRRQAGRTGSMLGGMAHPIGSEDLKAIQAQAYAILMQRRKKRPLSGCATPSRRPISKGARATRIARMVGPERRLFPSVDSSSSTSQSTTYGDGGRGGEGGQALLLGGGGDSVGGAGESRPSSATSIRSTLEVPLMPKLKHITTTKTTTTTTTRPRREYRPRSAKKTRGGGGKVSGTGKGERPKTPHYRAAKKSSQTKYVLDSMHNDADHTQAFDCDDTPFRWSGCVLRQQGVRHKHIARVGQSVVATAPPSVKKSAKLGRRRKRKRKKDVKGIAEVGILIL